MLCTGLLEMPIEANSSLTIQLLLIQFLSRIYDGDKLGKMFWTYVTFTSLVVLRMKPEQWLYIYIYMLSLTQI